MNARIVSYGRGARWLGEGWRIFRVAPLGWIALLLAYWMLMTLASILPFVGLAAASVLVPPFSVGFMAAARAAAAGGRPEFGHLFSGFRERIAGQLALGAVYAALLALVIGATALADEGALARWLFSGRRPEDEVLQSDAFLAALGTAAGLYLPVTMMYWFAPVLVAWHGFGVVQALFYSFFACLLNWRAFLAYSAVTAAVTIVLPLIVLSALLLASGGALRASATAIVFPLILILLPTLFASFYASYRDVFGEVPAEPTATQGITQP